MIWKYSDLLLSKFDGLKLYDKYCMYLDDERDVNDLVLLFIPLISRVARSHFLNKDITDIDEQVGSICESFVFWLKNKWVPKDQSHLIVYLIGMIRNVLVKNFNGEVKSSSIENPELFRGDCWEQYNRTHARIYIDDAGDLFDKIFKKGLRVTSKNRVIVLYMHTCLLSDTPINYNFLSRRYGVKKDRADNILSYVRVRHNISLWKIRDMGYNNFNEEFKSVEQYPIHN